VVLRRSPYTPRDVSVSVTHFVKAPVKPPCRSSLEIGISVCCLPRAAGHKARRCDTSSSLLNNCYSYSVLSLASRSLSAASRTGPIKNPRTSSIQSYDLILRAVYIAAASVAPTASAVSAPPKRGDLGGI